MMILRSSPASPFARKVRMAIDMLGLGDRVEIVETDVIDPADSIREQNPLGKIPALILEDRRVIYDSLVIVLYLDSLSDAAELLPSGARRFDVLTRHALADGLMEAALAQVYEKRFRPEEKWHPGWMERQAEKVGRALDALESDPPDLGAPSNLAQIATACALGYLDLRFEGAWRSSHPGLVAWLDAFAAKVPAFARTAPPAGV